MSFVEGPSRGPTGYVCLLSAAMLLASACTGEAGAVGPEDDENRKPQIVGGKYSDSFTATGSLYVMNLSHHFCTATLTAPNKVLTAAHCTEAIDKYPGQVYFILGVDLKGSKVRARVSSYVNHPQYNKTTIDHDIAVVTLATSITSVKPAVVLHSNPSGLKGQNMVLVGYGQDGVTTAGGVRREAEVTFAEVRPWRISYIWKGQASCYGDSGGPAYIHVGGKWQQVGITSHGSQKSCFAKSYYTRIDTHKNFILANGLGGADRTVTCGGDGACDGACRQDPDCKHLTGTGPPPPGGGGGGGTPPPPGGGGGTPPPGGGTPPPGGGGLNYGSQCSQNQQCQSGLCSGDPNGGPSFCSQECTNGQPCPWGHQCWGTQYPSLKVCAPKSQYTPPAQKPFGSKCNSSGDCQTGYCAGHPYGGGYCTYSCGYYYGCPSGSRCLPTNYSGFYICGPNGY